jgi:chemotaxis protein methyltransferase CheR
MPSLKARDFQRLAAFIEGTSGIKMPPTKKSLVEGRLRRRIRALGMVDFDEYCAFLFQHQGLDSEAVHIIDAVTTNKTDFFREPEHFTFLTENALPRLAAHRKSGWPPIKVWSAPCSIGAEPYTLAMVISDFIRIHPGLRCSILGTDICTEALRDAVRAVYPEEMIAPVPVELRKRYILKSKDRHRRQVRMAPELRQLVRFAHLNLMDERYPVDTDFDIIFCRNLLIYFDKPTQQAVLRHLCAHLRPGGYLFLGHSETIAGFRLPLRQVVATVLVRE